MLLLVPGPIFFPFLSSFSVATTQLLLHFHHFQPAAPSPSVSTPSFSSFLAGTNLFRSFSPENRTKVEENTFLLAVDARPATYQRFLAKLIPKSAFSSPKILGQLLLAIEQSRPAHPSHTKQILLHLDLAFSASFTKSVGAAKGNSIEL
eukprot:XP_025014529.1 uncharacterized protein LOC112536150 [Ricinus communis]